MTTTRTWNEDEIIAMNDVTKSSKVQSKTSMVPEDLAIVVDNYSVDLEPGSSRLRMKLLKGTATVFGIYEVFKWSSPTVLANTNDTVVTDAQPVVVASITYEAVRIYRVLLLDRDNSKLISLNLDAWWGTTPGTLTVRVDDV